MVHNVLLRVFTLGIPISEVFETHFFDIVPTQYGHPTYVKHVLGSIYIVFIFFPPYFGNKCGGRGGTQGIPTKPAQANFHPRPLKNGSY